VLPRKLLPAVLSACCLLTGIPCVAVADDLGATPQLLANSGFEAGTGEAASDWGLWPPTASHQGVSSLRDREAKHSGDHSGRLRVTDPAFEGICTWHHPAVPVTPGQELLLEYWSRAEGVTGSAGCDVQLRHGVQEIVGSRAAPEFKGSHDWTRTVHRFTVPEGTDHVCVVPLLRGTGTVWFDDFALYGTPTARPQSVLVPPRIDGELTDGCWRSHSALSGFSLADGSGLPGSTTEAWVAYDQQQLYIAFRCHKAPGDALRANVKLRDGPVWDDDDVEVFLDLTGTREDYYQFVVNPLGTRYDSHRTDPSWSIEWSAAARQGPDAWTVELGIPLAQLPMDLETSTHWGLNLCRADKVRGEVSAWSCTFGGFHNAGRLGTLAGLEIDLSSRFAADAGERLERLRKTHADATAGVDPAGAPEWVSQPFNERDAGIVAAMGELAGLLREPAETSREQWAQFSGRVDELTRSVDELRAAGLGLRVYNAWREGDAEAPRAGLASCSPMVKVLRSGQGFSGDVAREVRLEAAGNEGESAQVVVVSLAEESISGCRASMSNLQGPGGALIGPDAIDLRVVGYVKTAQPKYATSFVGEWPDPLLPNRPFTLPAKELQPLWLTVRVPVGATAGDYDGKLRVEVAGRTLEMAVKLHVFGFSLPVRQHLATPFGCDPGDLSRWYTGSSDYMTHLPPDVFTRWNRFLLDYRVTPTRVGQSYIREQRAADGTVAYDYSVADECVAAVADRLAPKSVDMASVGQFGWRGQNGASLTYVDGGAEGTARAARARWPRTDGWASLNRSLDGKRLAMKGCRAFTFHTRCPDDSMAGERVVAFVNDFPNRWVTTFTLGGAGWQQVRINLEQYHHNETGVPLDLAALSTVGDFQFVIDRKTRPIEYLMDQIVADCEGGDVLVDDFELVSEVAEVQRRVGAQLEHWREKGWFGLGHVYGWDEARPDEYEQVVAAYSKVLGGTPDAPIMQTYYTNPTPAALTGVVKIWCAITSVYNEQFLEQRRAAGDDVWLYVCCGPTPPYANFFIDEPGVDHRIVFWQAWARRATGFLYWRVNYWHGMFPQTPEAAQWPDRTWDLSDLATYKEFKVNGDGWLVYPGPDMTPWPSVRLENIRDGIEDYECLCLLREAAPGHPLLAPPAEVCGSLTEYLQDPDRITTLRRKVSAALDANL